MVLKSVLRKSIRQPSSGIFVIHGGLKSVTPTSITSLWTFTNVPTSSLVTARKVKLSGIGEDAVISITSGTGEYSINGGAWTSDAGTISDGDILRARQTSSANYETETTLEITIDGTACTMSVTTEVEVTGFPYELPFELG